MIILMTLYIILLLKKDWQKIRFSHIERDLNELYRVFTGTIKYEPIGTMLPVTYYAIFKQFKE